MYEGSLDRQPFKDGDFVGITVDGFISNLDVDVYFSNKDELREPLDENKRIKREYPSCRRYWMMLRHLFRHKYYPVRYPERNLIFCRVNKVGHRSLFVTNKHFSFSGFLITLTLKVKNSFREIFV